ncbi:hypothetical protein [Paenibacillus physcomitrellae]|uniref:Uncharacterized protein n=1 Tax=Paenibacillus physcomitrellae TaxID=1619311 RepID=A0ABQ1GJ30_9BACL|nr:hypothetical protein [Paenibacillus physcomitrellae]GGA44937.1 hypothetical protein GCM10010917_32830 [Paenibacillus physcomitrellae]
MANTKWIKWATGLAGVLMFTGFVGYLSKGEQQEGAIGNPSLAAGGTQSNQAGSGNPKSDITDQWQNDMEGNSSDSGTNSSASRGERYEERGNFGSGHERGGFAQGGDQSLDSGDSSNGDNDMFRTRAS